jgi:hypothetical protein
MNANGLAKLYDRITVWERIPLLIAAQARGDDAEYKRLFDASPRRTAHIPEHLLDEHSLHVLALIYLGEQLYLAASHFFFLFKLQAPDDPQPEDWLIAAESNAYIFARNAEAWRRLCSELSIAPEALYRPGPFLRYCEEKMQANAPTAEALQALFREWGRDAPQLVTADELLIGWRNLLQDMTHGAPPGKEEE